MEAHAYNVQQGVLFVRGASVPQQQRSPPGMGDQALGHTRREDRRTATEILKKQAGLGRIVGRSQAVEGVRRQIEVLSSYKISVLICGETGTGKELAARAIHYLSDRAGGPFVPVNCGAIPENLFENELFGHVRGAFTDARVPQIGLVQEAEGGTLFLDEIGAISPYNQVKLLRLLQDSEYKRLGDARPHKANVRIVAATNRDLPTLVREGAFREDLYYRLDVAFLRRIRFVVTFPFPDIAARRDRIIARFYDYSPTGGIERTSMDVTWRLVEETLRLLRPGGTARYVTHNLDTARYLAGRASQLGLAELDMLCDLHGLSDPQIGDGRPFCAREAMQRQDIGCNHIWGRRSGYGKTTIRTKSRRSRHVCLAGGAED